MRQQIEAKIAEWEQGREQLQMERQRLARQLQEIDVAIERNTGAIIGGRELVAMMPEEPTESQSPQPD
jgi:hypothetical protein